MHIHLWKKNGEVVQWVSVGMHCSWKTQFPPTEPILKTVGIVKHIWNPNTRRQRQVDPLGLMLVSFTYLEIQS